MKIIILTSMVGLGSTLNPGDIIDLPERQAVKLINAGFAQVVKDAPIETATLPDPLENTSTPQRKTRQKQGK